MFWPTRQEFNEVVARISRLERRLMRLTGDVQRAIEGNEMASRQLQQVIDNLKSEVTRNTDVVASTKALIAGLVAQVEQNKDDPEELEKILTAFKENNDALAAAVPASTPSADPNTPPPSTDTPPSGPAPV